MSRGQAPGYDSRRSAASQKTGRTKNACRVTRQEDPPNVFARCALESKDQSGGKPLWRVPWVRKIEKLAVGTVPFRQDSLAGGPGQQARLSGRALVLQRAGCAEGRR